MKNLEKIKIHFLVFLPFLLFLHFPVSAQMSLVFNVSGTPPLNTDKHDGFIDEVTREALKRIGYKLVIQRLPAERGLRLLNSGGIDGEMVRVQGLNKIYPNIIRVPEKIMDWDFVAFSKIPINLEQGWLSFTNKNVSFINGWKILEKNIPSTAYVTKTKNSSQLFDLLEKNRTDYIIYESWGGRFIIRNMNNKDIIKRTPALASKEMFLYLSSKHAALVPKLAKAISNMKKDGTYKKLEEKHLHALLKK